jgi:sodium/hydrogen exchanger family protein
MDWHTHSSAFQYISQRKLHVELLSRSGWSSVGYVRGLSIHPSVGAHLSLRSSDPGYCLGHHHRCEVCVTLVVSRQTGFTGYLFSRLLRSAYTKGFLDRESYVAQYIALALFTAGATNSLGNDDLLAAFAAGMLISHHISLSAHPIPMCRQCNCLGRSLQPTDQRRRILLCPRSCSQLRLLYLYWSMASIRSIRYPRTWHKS